MKFELWVDGRLFDEFTGLPEAYQAALDYPERDTLIEFKG